jgi:ABC-2 type transport system ATP-binding protein
MERVGLDPRSPKWVSRYSLGMRQRLAIAQSIMEKPTLLILDEPMNGLDSLGVRQMRRLFAGLRAGGRTILIASHNPLDIDRLCDTVSRMEGGVLTGL